MPHVTQVRLSASSKRWQARQGKDKFVAQARVHELKSRAAFKLLEIHDKHKIFRKGQTVIDLGYAPGSWSQVAVDRTSPNGRVIGIDVIPAQPPRGMSTIQGNFLTRSVQDEVKRFIRDSNGFICSSKMGSGVDREQRRTSPVIITESGPENLDCQAQTMSSIVTLHKDNYNEGEGLTEVADQTRTVDVVLSDMSAPWDQTDGFWKRSISNPYHRMMNTSGIGLKDHVGSMDLCNAALEFSADVLKPGGHFVCKFYQGYEDKALEQRLKSLFSRVYREKPGSSRKESKEGYFIALKKRSQSILP